MGVHGNSLPNTGKTVILQVAPETGRLPIEMGPLATYISGKSGGMGEVVSTLCEGLTNRGIECHLATLNLTQRFRQENNLDKGQWNRIVGTIDPDRIHLVNSAVFSNLPDAYAGNPVVNAAEFQKTLVNQIIPRIRAKNGGRLIIHSHDWMAGGIITAYAKSIGCPVLHTVHNVHTGHIPREFFFGVDMAETLGLSLRFRRLGKAGRRFSGHGYQERQYSQFRGKTFSPGDRGRPF